LNYFISVNHIVFLRLIHLLGSHEGSYQTQSNEINALQKEIKFRDEKLRVSESNLEKLNLSLNERNDKLAKLEIEYERLKNEKASQDELLVKMKDDSQKHSKDLSAKAMALADAERRLQV
jgi:septal ring factor EnvC (AmiA/AmiB activator)